MLRPEHPFPPHIRTLTPSGSSASDASAIQELKASVLAIRLALLDIDASIAALERFEPTRESRWVQVKTREVPEVDPLVYRVDQLRVGCEEILRRPLNTLERDIVMNWASLEREGVPVPVMEILDLTRHLMSRPTPDGTLPGTLKWCAQTVQTLARASVASLRGRGGKNQAAELASLYGEMADRLESEGRGDR
jgi:hypothetical protein